MKTVTSHKDRADRLFLLACLTVVTLFLLVSAFVSQSAAAQQRSFSSPDEAVQQFVGAVRGNDAEGIIAILGPGGRELVSSGDEVADRTGREKFLRAYDQAHSLQKKSAARVILTIGADNWPLPIPVVKKGKAWTFDTREGQQEILNRRIGRNELRVMETLHAYVEAQREYACGNYSGSGLGEFAQQLISSGGKRDGLYWQTKEGGKESPLGPLVALAAEEGYRNSDLQPFHGYYFRILKGQGRHAEGGAYSYVVKGKMILGFAIVAYPAEYRNSGVMTFIVNQKGVIYQKDLGKNTKRKAEAMRLFDPDKTWKRVEETADEK